jgi:formyltetrahydrofolate deformylase
VTTRSELARDGKLRRPDPLLPHGADFVLTLSCGDVPGIVHAVSGVLYEQGCNILDSAQFDDPLSNRFFMRVAFAVLRGHAAEDGLGEELQRAFDPIAKRFGMTFTIRDQLVKPRLLLMVSRHGHCLNDLLFRYGSGELPVDVPAIVSNHRDFEPLAAMYGIPYRYLPVSPQTQDEQEVELLALIERERIDLVVLARYMRVLRPSTCAALTGRAINIHHSFLPSFKGANPYRQAHERGVKLIGATAHYVTDDLDEGPIIEQDVARVDHASSVADFVATGRDVECMVLARAVKYHVAQRVLLNGPRTVVFR